MKDFKLQQTDAAYVAELDGLFSRRIEEIKGTKSEWTLGKYGICFYVSNDGDDENEGFTPEKPLKTLQRVMELQSKNVIRAGDVVLLRRGDEFHTKFTTKQGVSYSAYGEGAKPRVLASIEADDPEQWIKTEYENLYKFNGEVPFELDVGNIVFNDGEAFGQRVMKSLTEDMSVEAGDNFVVSNGLERWEFPPQEFHDQRDLKFDLQFYHNWEEKALYLYSTKGNPGDLFESIELCTYGNAVRACSDVLIDNWCIKFTGSHGIGAGSCTNLIVRNCEIGWIGGSVQHIRNEKATRYGNAVEIYGAADGYEVYNCYMYQCFDCGPTVQCGGSSMVPGKRIVEENIAIHDNVLWDADLEVWLITKVDNDEHTFALLKNCRLYNNLVTRSGYGFGGYNHYKNEYCSFYGAGETRARYEDCFIEDNIFWRIKKNLWKAVATTTENGKGFHWRNNTILLKYNQPIGFLGSDTKNAKGRLTKYYYNDETVAQLIEDGCFGVNRFMCIPDDFNTDPFFEARLY